MTTLKESLSIALGDSPCKKFIDEAKELLDILENAEPNGVSNDCTL